MYCVKIVRDHRMRNTKTIELNVLAESGNSIMVERWKGKVQGDTEAFRLHRSDHYTCLLLETGQIDLLLDFREVTIYAHTLFIFHPGQVHEIVSATDVNGWYLSFNNKLVEDN